MPPAPNRASAQAAVTSSGPGSSVSGPAVGSARRSAYGRVSGPGASTVRRSRGTSGASAGAAGTVPVPVVSPKVTAATGSEAVRGRAPERAQEPFTAPVRTGAPDRAADAEPDADVAPDPAPAPDSSDGGPVRAGTARYGPDG